MADKFKLPDHSTKPQDTLGAAAWMNEIDKSVRRLATGGLLNFVPSASDDLSGVKVGSGRLIGTVGFPPMGTALTLPPPPTGYTMYADGVFAVANNLVVMYRNSTDEAPLCWAVSTDGGVNWQLRSDAGLHSLSGYVPYVATNGNTCVIAQSGVRYRYSVDAGITWAEMSTVVGFSPYCITWAEALGKFVAVGASAGFWSPTGLPGSWTSLTVPAGTWHKVCCSDAGRLLLKNSTGTAVSDDGGVSWTQFSDSATPTAGELKWNQQLGHFICASDDHVAVSATGESWAVYAVISGTKYGITDITWDGTKYIATGTAPSYITDMTSSDPTKSTLVTSTNGADWSALDLQTPIKRPWMKIVSTPKYGVFLVGLRTAEGSPILRLPEYASEGAESSQQQLVIDVPEAVVGLAPPPVALPRVDRVVLNVITGVATYLVGVEATVPTPPEVPQQCLSICQVERVPGSSVCTEYQIKDERGTYTGPEVTGTNASNEVTAYGAVSQYRVFSVPGVNLFKKPAGASWYQVTLVGGGGGPGGAYIGTTNVTLGGAGGGAASNSVKMVAEDLTVTVGAGGAPGVSGASGMTAGTAGGASSITGAISSVLLVANGGGGGGAASSSPAVGAAGAAGTATNGGIAGTAGATGITSSSGMSFLRTGGAVGELGQLSYPTLTANQIGLREKMGAGANSGWSGVNAAPSNQLGGNGYVLIEWG